MDVEVAEVVGSTHRENENWFRGFINTRITNNYATLIKSLNVMMEQHNIYA